ncbi:hypothetical protein [Streptomyces sp. LN245]|uniref:hypothetical protein n=1 Tax=Streptomyces sp. LN245 TaxID=3112975 RepID=UPI0037245264
MDAGGQHVCGAERGWVARPGFWTRIRTALRALGQDTAPVLAVTEPPAQPREPRRRWWQRRG